MPLELDFGELPNSDIQSLYKFKSFDGKGYYKDLLNNIIWLSSRTELNDPFDCRVKLNYDLCSDEQIKGIIRNHIPSQIPENIRNKMVDKQFQRRKDDPLYYKESLEKGIDKSLGIFSLTADFNVQMWSRYAEEHAGFCIEFDAMKLYKELYDKFQSRALRIFIFRVEYVDELPEINPCEASLDEKSKMFKLKTKNWVDENEWRIVLFDGSNKKEPIDPQCIKNIYFGKSVDQTNFETSVKILKISNPNIGLYKAIKRKNAFGLDFEKIK